MDKEYLTKLIFLESVAIYNLMKMRLYKIVVIWMESRQREQNQRKLQPVTWNEQAGSSS